MGRSPCCDKANVKKGPWSPEEDATLKEYIEKYGTGGNWIALPKKAGLKRCGKSCRLRWLNYLRPNIKHGEFSESEDRIICSLYANIGSRWSIIAGQLPGRTDNDIKNYWNTKLKKKLMGLVNPANISHHRRKPHHQQVTASASTFSSLLQASSLPTSPISPYNTAALVRSFTEPVLLPSSPHLSNNYSFSFTSPNLQATQESTFVSPLQHYQVMKDGVLMFGGDQASCSSSDNASSNNNNNNNHINHGNKKLEYEYGINTDRNQICSSQNYFYEEENQQKLMMSNGSVNGSWGENPLENYGLDEIKQLISSGTSGGCNNFLFEENKTIGERVIYY